MLRAIFEALAQSARDSESVALGIITGVKGSSPQKVGAKAVFYPDGRIEGTMGGGCLEAEIQRRAIQSLRTGRPESFDLLLDHDFGWDDGLLCGGQVTGLILPNAQDAGLDFWQKLAAGGTVQVWSVDRDFKIRSEPGSASLYTETVRPPVSLWIAGAGHIAQAVAPLALQLDFAVTVLDDRPALANTTFFPAAVNLKAQAWDQLLALPLPEGPLFGLIVTRGHKHDALVLREWIRKPFTFLGMIGSSRKARTIFAQFREENLATEEQLQRVACPVGLQIRAQSVMEIAVSIAAQLVQKRAEMVSIREVAITENPMSGRQKGET